MAAPKTIHIEADSSGAWIVRAPGGGKGRSFPTQADAVRAAQVSVRDAGGEVVVHAHGRPKRSFTLGRSAMAKLNAVEGLALTASGKSAFKVFDQQELTPTQRRAALRTAVPNLAGSASNGKAKAKTRPSRKRTITLKS